MSAYPSLLSPLMDATGLIATAALNTVAQTALASGVSANEKVDILQDIALKSVANVYTGLPTSSMVIDGDITATEFRITNAKLEENKLTLADGLGRANIYARGNELWTDSSLNVSKTIQSNEGISLYPLNGNAILECSVPQNYIKSYSSATLDGFGTAEFATVKATQVSGTVFQNNDSSFSVDFEGNATVKQLNYTTLFPAIPEAQVPTLAQVLTAGNVASANIDMDNSNYSIVGVDYVQADNYLFNGVVGGLQPGRIVLAYGVDNTNATISNGVDGTLVIDSNELSLIEGTTSFANKPITEVRSLAVNESITSNTLETTGNITSNGVIVKSNLITIASINSDGLATATSLDIRNDAHSLKAQIDANGAITCPTINAVAPQFKPTYDYYVSKGGSDSGLGSVLSPFLTVQHAITVCEAFTDGVPRVVHLSSGTYTENLVFHKSRISIVGENVSMNSDVGSSISGTVTINITSGNSDMNNNNIYFSGLLINGEIQDSTNSFVHRLFFTNCYLYANSRCLLMNVIGDYRLFVDRCNISNSSTSAINTLVQCLGTGMVSFTNSKLTSKGLEQMTCVISVNCRIDLFANNILTSDSTSTTAPTILWLGTSELVSIGNCGFIYSSSAVKSNATAAGIRLTSSGSLVIVQSFFSLAGLPFGQNAIQNGGLGVVIFCNNCSTSSLAGTSASSISGTLNVNKFAGTSVQ